MFYLDELDKEFRFGDIISGFVLAEATLQTPPSNQEYCIDVTTPKFCVILTPCCSIGDKVISLTPLIHVRNSFYNNPYFAEDLTNINRKMRPEQTLAPLDWVNLKPVDRMRREAEGLTFAFIDFFVFAGHDLLPRYTVNRRAGNIETNSYMIDFRGIYRVKCGKIINPKDAPSELKVLQLTVDSRAELREKMASYFSRPTKEDMSFNV